MEETLTDCLVRVREDLTHLQKVRDYLETNAETQEPCSVTWRTIEAFNSILSVCSSQNSPETSALDTLLDSFFYLARNNTDSTVWEDFGFELGIICVKVLSAIERTKVFEVLFCKLLSIIGIICEHNSNVWKATARQILNVLINKKITLPNLETILKLYICTLRRIDNDTLTEFSSQNFHLLKTLSLLVQKIGDFELQYDITHVIYLHLTKDSKLMSEIFEKHFIHFDSDCRLYLNSLNKSRRSSDRMVYSICCHVLYLGGCFVEPPIGKNFIWVDANKDTERLSIKYSDSESEGDRVLYVPFSGLLNVQFEKDKTEGNLCLTIKTKNQEMGKDNRGDICIVTENVEGVYEFVKFLESAIGVGVKKKKKKTSKTMESLVIDRGTPKKEVQDNAVTSSERPGIEQILPDALSILEKPKHPKTSQELSPNSFVESLNKHIGMDNSEPQRAYEDSIDTIEFLQKTTPKKNHKLFRSPDKIFDISEIKESDVVRVGKENQPPKIKTYNRKPKRQTDSQECFRGSSVLKKKPFLPKLKRSRTKVQGELEKRKENPKPSLLDPNGYAYQRWCKPTTSERSNFWLKKLNSLQKQKDAEDVFDFSEESDSIFGKSKKRRVVHTKRKWRTKKRTEIRKKVTPPKARSPPKRDVTPENKHEEYESLPPSDDEDPPENKKRDRSEEESFKIKKKTKMTLPKNLLSVVRHRLAKVEEKDRRYTSEIIQTVDKATNHFFNHLQRKDRRRVVSYLKTAEDVLMSFENELEDLNLRAKRIQRVILYYKAGCSIGEYCEYLDSSFLRVREELKGLKEPGDSQKTVKRIFERVSGLIGAEIEKSFEAEWVLKREKLLKCASILGGNFEPEL